MQSLYEFCFEPTNVMFLPKCIIDAVEIVGKIADFGLFVCLQCTFAFVFVPMTIGVAVCRVFAAWIKLL
jgi:hypothetical protein